MTDDVTDHAAFQKPYNNKPLTLTTLLSLLFFIVLTSGITVYMAMMLPGHEAIQYGKINTHTHTQMHEGTHHR